LEHFDFHKYHALGNDYLVVDPGHTSIALNPTTVQRLCDRHTGIGADGVLYGPTFDEAGRITLRIFNPDGSEAEKSGNGVRIFARYLNQAGYLAGAEFVVSTLGGEVAGRILDGPGDLIQVDVGVPSFWSQDIPMTGLAHEVVAEPATIGGHELTITCVSLGNPHCVIFSDDVTKEHMLNLGPLVERAPLFPNRTNVQLCKILHDHTIAIEIWERGAGRTLASGTSSCAAASAARRLGRVGDSVTVEMPGGRLRVEFLPNGHILLTGPVAGVARGCLHRDLLE
jgi:diaminopimelate epimerase